MVGYAYNYLLVGSWINCMLFMLEVVLAVRYFRHSSRSLLHRAGMSAIVASDTLCTFAICAKIYMLVSLYPSQPPHGFPRFGLETLTVILCSTYATASLAQLFLCALYFNLTKRRVITVLLVFSIVAHLSFSCASAVLVVVTGSPLGWALITSKIGAISCAATDSMIAAALLHIFIRMDATSAFRGSTHNLLRRLIVLFLSSGVIVASTTLLSMILLLNNKPAYSLFFFILKGACTP
ncbi:hypothetical protein MVEN_01659300 [Mycena venus]|uniref:Uncharacterized protein n=1 Tax=Mycena venus TaxID=2733690 RepID=A0A8H7CQX9_9AGAR|nr:hypothetical protein MVEN_01659300 [Mycena venus]